MTAEDEFDEWYDEYFGNAQGEDSPYTYNDVKIAFLKGWKLSKNRWVRKKTRCNNGSMPK